MNMRHMRRIRSHSRRRHGNGAAARGKGRPEVVSEDEDEDRSVVGEDGNNEEGEYEFDVQLKVWRRSRANVWRTPSIETGSQKT